jgi:hypothetical protein
MGVGMYTSQRCRANANRCIEMANEVTEPQMRDKLFALAAEWLNMAREFEREATDYEEMLKSLRRHLGVQQIGASKH